MRRAIVVLILLLLTACGDAVPTPGGSAGASTTAEPSVADPSEGALPSASSTSAASEVALAAHPAGSVDGAPLGYLEFLPSGYGSGDAAPLLVFLHGSGEAGDGSAEALSLVDDLGLPRLIRDGDWPDDRPFIVLSPQYGTEAAEGECAFGDDLAEFLAFATEHYEVDPARVYLTGVSCGAIGMWDYLATHGDDLVAAAVPISSHAEWALEKSGCGPLAEVPVWAFNGAEDEVIPVVHIEGPMEQIASCEGAASVEAELTLYPDADHVGAIDRTYDLSAGHDIYAWLLDHAND